MGIDHNSAVQTFGVTLGEVRAVAYHLEALEFLYHQHNLIWTTSAINTFV